jgi:hypothetical protein
VEKLVDVIVAGVGAMLQKLFLDNPTAAAWAIAFIVSCYALYKVVLYARGLQEKLDASLKDRETALILLTKAHEEKINAKDVELTLLHEKFHEHVSIATNAFSTVKNTLLRTNSKAYIVNCHNGIQAIGEHIGLKLHMLNMPPIQDTPSDFLN